MKSRFFFILFICLCFVPITFGQANSYKDVPIVNYCDVIENPQPYKEKLVKISAEWSSGFEFSGLGSQKCAEKYGRIWAEWEKYKSCGDEKTAQLLANRNKGIENNYLEGIFVGKFFVKEEGKSGFGHMNAKLYKIAISCVESAILLPKENAGCARVDKTSPFHYLEYVKTELGIAPDYQTGRRKKENLVWFRLVNNSSCPIIVPTAGNQTKLENQAEVPVIYKLDATIRTAYSSMTPINNPVRMSVNSTPTRSALSAGDSVYFAVPLKFLKKSFKIWRSSKSFWNVRVSFEYADKIKEINYDPFYFAHSDLPKKIFEK